MSFRSTLHRVTIWSRWSGCPPRAFGECPPIVGLAVSRLLLVWRLPACWYADYRPWTLGGRPLVGLAVIRLDWCRRSNDKVCSHLCEASLCPLHWLSGHGAELQRHGAWQYVCHLPRWHEQPRGFVAHHVLRPSPAADSCRLDVQACGKLRFGGTRQTHL